MCVAECNLDRRLLGGCLGDQIGYQVGVALTATALLLAACAAGPNQLVDTGPDPAGFWLGLWQSLISPITFIVSLFTTNVNVYEAEQRQLV
jgi:hypothetical protein